MKPFAVPAFAAALALAALLAPSAPLRAQTAPPNPATGAPAPWRPLIVVDPREVLRAQRHHALERKPTPRPRAHPTAAPGTEVFERYDTASPRPR
ncbi:MAG: hypothetical protein QOI11_2710 [Candidatus Eremiobacteraeota bacterium]|jgi:hypothetical protein|nr:hypothetical protein [Candidatus Eremiobacteraeota bacterium]